MSDIQKKPPGATWEAKNAALENAFRKLPIKRFEKSSGIPYEFLIPGLSRELLLMSPVPRPKSAPPKKALRNLIQSTGSTIEVLDSLPRVVLEALNFKPTALRELKIRLRILHAAAKTADVKSDKGAPQKPQPAKIAVVVARNYYGLTGKKPTVPKKDGKAYGPFPDLLETVFGILGVEASAESQGNKIAKNWDSIVAKFEGRLSN